MDISGGIREPLRIDEKMWKKEIRTFTRVLVDVDFTKPLVDEILLQTERFGFITSVEYENLPSFCRHCVSVGHDVCQCRVLNREEGSQLRDKNTNKL